MNFLEKEKRSANSRKLHTLAAFFFKAKEGKSGTPGKAYIWNINKSPVKQWLRKNTIEITWEP